jgi:hypothetical protein
MLAMQNEFLKMEMDKLNKKNQESKKDAELWKINSQETDKEKLITEK